jgi:hypothetical protein
LILLQHTLLLALFDYNHIKDAEGSRKIRHINGLYTYWGKCYTEDGFWIQSSQRSDLDDVTIQPNKKELALFQKSNDVLIQNAVKAA